MVGVWLVFKKLTNYFPEFLHHFTFPPVTYGWSRFSGSSPACGVATLLYCSCSVRRGVVFHCDLSLQFPNSSWWWLSRAYLPSGCPVQCSVSSRLLLIFQLFYYFLFLNFWEFYMSEIRILCQMCDMWCVAYLFILLTVPYAEFLFSMQSNHQLPFYGLCFGCNISSGPNFLRFPPVLSLSFIVLEFTH